MFTHGVSVPERCVEGLCVWEEQILNICQARHLELLRPLLDHLPEKQSECVCACVFVERNISDTLKCRFNLLCRGPLFGFGFQTSINIINTVYTCRTNPYNLKVNHVSQVLLLN